LLLRLFYFSVLGQPSAMFYVLRSVLHTGAWSMNTNTPFLKYMWGMVGDGKRIHTNCVNSLFMLFLSRFMYLFHRCCKFWRLVFCRYLYRRESKKQKCEHDG
jgi:hypothetical protein